MRRREFIAVVAGALSSPVTADAQQTGKMPLIGILNNGSATSTSNHALFQGLRELGYTQGQNLAIEFRFAHWQLDRLPALAAELVALKVDIIVAGATPAARAAKQATRNAFSTMIRWNADALIVLPSPMLFAEHRRIVELAAKTRLPAMYQAREFVDAGGLMSYGANIADLNRRAARYVDKILKGTKPADLPVEQPTKFELLVNLKTARELGLTISREFLLIADEVIE